MYQMGKQEMPPLWIWLAVVVTLLLATGVLYQIALLKDKKEFDAKLAYVQQRLATAGNKPVVLLLGTSLTKCGVDSAAKLETAIAQQAGTRPVVIKVWRPATSLETLLKAMPALQNVHPNVLVVEANMLISALDITPLSYRLRNAMRDATRFRITGKPYYPDRVDYVNTEKKFALRRFSNGVTDTSRLQLFREFARQWQACGARILLVDFPLQSSEELTQWNRDNAVTIKRNLSFIQSRVPAKYCSTNTQWDSTYFFDGAHLSPKGAQVFSAWLCTTIANELR